MEACNIYMEQEALNKLKVPPGYKIELFASEKEFPDLAKPMQISFDNKGTSLGGYYAQLPALQTRRYQAK